MAKRGRKSKEGFSLETISKSDLKGLTRGQKAELLKLLRQKTIKGKESVLDEFEPNAGCQSAFFRSLATIRLMVGANGIGKTTSLIVELLRTHLRKHEKREVNAVYHSWFVISGLDKSEDYVAELKRWCPPSKFPKLDKMGGSTVRRLHWPNNSITTFYSFDQDLQKFESTNIDALFIDEPPPRDIFSACYRGLRHNKNYFVVMAMTLIGEPWIYSELYLPGVEGRDPRIEVFTGTMYENRYLSREYIEDFKSRLSDDEVEVRVYGKIQALQGRVFKEFDRTRHVIPRQDWPKEWPVWVAIDPHVRKPHCVLWVGVTSEDNLVVVDELREKGEIFELAEEIKKRNRKLNVVSIRIDTSGSQLDWNRDSAVEILENHGVHVSPMKAHEKQVDSGIQKIKQLLKGERLNKKGDFVPRLKVMEHCHGLIEEFELYSWNEHRDPARSGLNEKPRKLYDDGIDCLRYIVMSKPVAEPSYEAFDLFDGASLYRRG